MMHLDPAEAADLIRRASHPLAPRPTDVAVRGPKLPEIRIVLLDVYGTLLVSASGDIGAPASGAEEAALAQARALLSWTDPCPPISALRTGVAAHHARSRAAGVDWPEVDIRAVWRAAFAESGLPVPPGPRLEALALAYELMINPVWPMPGFPHVLRRLRSRVRLGLVSNAQFYTPLVLEALAGCSLGELGVEDALCAWSYRQGRAKPSPALWQPVGDHLRAEGVAPEHVLMVGNDQRKDVEPACRWGFRTALFAGDQRSLRMDPGAANPEAVLTDLEQLVALLG